MCNRQCGKDAVKSNMLVLRSNVDSWKESMTAKLRIRCWAVVRTCPRGGNHKVLRCHFIFKVGVCRYKSLVVDSGQQVSGVAYCNNNG